MKTIALATALTAACTAVLVAAAPETPSVNQLQVFPKNLARQHYGANLFIFDKATQRFVPTEAAAAWLDEDSVTGWPALAGKQHYMLQFVDSQILTNLTLSAKQNDGTLSIYTSDQAVPPGDAAWTQVAKDVPVEAVNQKRFSRALNKTAKYVLIETNIENPAPIYGLYVYGAKAAASESIVPRPQPIDVRTVGEFVNQQTAFNVASLYAHSRVTFSNAKGSNISWQRAIDDNPETTLSIAPSTGEAGAVIRFGDQQAISRLSLLGEQSARGTMDVFLLSQAPEAGQTVGLEGVAPSVSIKFDGTSARASADIAETNSVAMVLRWTPESGSSAFALRDIAAFSNISLADNEVNGILPVVAANTDEAAATKESETEKKMEETGTGSDGKDAKEVIAAGPGERDFKGTGKDVKEPIAEGPPIAAGPGGFTPGGLGFPPRTPRNPVSQ